MCKFMLVCGSKFICNCKSALCIIVKLNVLCLYQTNRQTKSFSNNLERVTVTSKGQQMVYKYTHKYTNTGNAFLKGQRQHHG